MISKIDELRKVRYEHRKTAYTIAALNKKLELEPNRNDLKAMRSKLLTDLQNLDLRRSQITSEVKASPYALADVVEVIDSLANIQSQIAHGGTEEGQLAISAFIRYLTHDKDRLSALEAGEEIPVHVPPQLPVHTPPKSHAETEKWRKLAGLRQGIISKLEKRIENRDARVATLEATLAEAHAKLTQKAA